MLFLAKLILPEVGDWGVSVFLTLLVGYCYGTQLEWKHFLWAFVFVIAPDLIPNPLWVWNKIFSAGSFYASDSHEHREFGHWPLLHFFIFAIIWIKYGKMFGALYGVCVLWHLFHDSFGIGWGIKPFAPFSDVSIKLFTDVENRDAFWPPRAQIRWPKDEVQAVERYGNDNWFVETYFRLTWVSVSEYIAFAVGMITLLVVKMRSK
ncbi:MAG: metal-dependent hydrolase [Candidatus Pacebacteria bacterium]|nr:metal-dependent hydrolase [Candidatus Paceibacterota bacterium]MDD5356549.1 metal-dependent hydrolase [Candidatus Paceibacterota bacterium]